MEPFFEGLLIEKYFLKWKQITKLQKDRKETLATKLEQREKLDNLIKVLKKHKNTEISKSPVPLQPQSESFKNRFDAQKSVINTLTLQLEEKNRIIEELKLGVLSKEALSNLDPKTEIRKLFADCSTRVKCKIPPPLDYSLKFMIATQKAPRIVQEMEERALLRLQRREIILARKHVLEENRRQLVAEAIENKKVQDEEEKRRSLELIKERRRKELELDRKRQERKTAFLQKLGKAVDLRRLKLLKRGFKALVDNHREARFNWVQSGVHYRGKITRKMLLKWTEFIDEKYHEKYKLADALFARSILLKSVICWREAHIAQIRAVQVAEDFHDFLLQKNTFIHWHRYICLEIVRRDKNMKLAVKHHDRWLKFHYFYQWRSLPAVLQLEKSKEQKLKRWRMRVWEVLPDYKPPNDEI